MSSFGSRFHGINFSIQSAFSSIRIAMRIDMVITCTGCFENFITQWHLKGRLFSCTPLMWFFKMLLQVNEKPHKSHVTFEAPRCLLSCLVFNHWKTKVCSQYWHLKFFILAWTARSCLLRAFIRLKLCPHLLHKKFRSAVRGFKSFWTERFWGGELSSSVDITSGSKWLTWTSFHISKKRIF